MNIPTFTDILLAQRQIRPYLPRTPLHSYPAINALIDTEVYILQYCTPIKFRFSLDRGETGQGETRIVVHDFSCGA